MTDVVTVASYIELVQTFSPPQGRVWYRGQQDYKWALEPSVRRDANWIENEVELLTRFRQLTMSRIARPPSDDWGWVTLAQHSRLPTRLLDWTENPLVALYFAVEPDAASQEDTEDGRVYALDPVGLNKKSYGSDIGLLLLDRDPKLDAYSPYDTDSQVHSPLAVVAPQAFDRLVAQSGTFTVWHKKYVGQLEGESSGLLDSWKVPVNRKKPIRDELYRLGVNAATVYPDLDRISLMIRNEYLSGSV